MSTLFAFIKYLEFLNTLGEQQVVVDCQNMVLAWLASKLGPKAANNMLRNLISCRVNKGT